MSILQRRLVRVAAAAVAIIALFSSGSTRAAVVYDYVGNNFIGVSGAFTTSDHITGFVEFATAPTSGETDKSNVSAFSFTAGPLTLDSTGFLFADFSFDFDSSLNIILWNAAVVGLGVSVLQPRFRICHNASQIILGEASFCSFNSNFDEAVAPDGAAGDISGAPGIWSLSPAPLPSPVPLPAALPLFLSALAGLGLMGWRRRQAGA